jgi:membrane associated rhomboid family serine protease
MLTYLIIALTCLISISAFQNKELFSKLLFSPSIIRTHKEWYRFFTHAFLHADWIHLLLNMYVLYLFGSLVEKIFVFYLGTMRGEVSFLILYISSIFASVIPSFQKHKDDFYYTAVGASGAVSAIVFSAIILEPQMELALMFLPIPLPAPIFGILYLAYCWYAAKHSHDNIAHDVHYWGSLFGVLFTLIVLPESFFSFIETVKSLIPL